ncbi:MAG: hypothetical protein E7773_13740 [Sphingomonas sp.]|uniref:hypothetical protein n=1 Tax=Sphingomonas sp. TaxID=28214 RepID=UPI001216CBCF|nr:hypothetical protein [Sphingomonas sp.]THD34724.1 MAG: hypothetical protein E7773_13740 [Sphingomonas sp.]
MPPHEERPLRDQLVEARAGIVAQLRELESPHYFVAGNNHEIIATLRAELNEIDQLLSGDGDGETNGLY